MEGKAIGLIETRGFVATVEALDVSLKASEVGLLSRTFTTGGLVCLAVTGDVASVKAAVDAGSAAARELNGLVSMHVIPRPSADVIKMIKASKGGKRRRYVKPAVEKEYGIAEKFSESEDTNSATLYDVLKDSPAVLYLEKGKMLQDYRVTELRKILRVLEIESITGRAISKMKKQEILEALKIYCRDSSEKTD